MKVRAGSYSGNGTSQDISTGIDQNLVIVSKVGAASVDNVWSSDTMAAGNSMYFHNTTGADSITTAITALGSGQFSVGAGVEVNQSGQSYRWIAFEDDGEGDFATFTYTGNDADDRAITGLGFQPAFVAIKGIANDRGFYKFSSLAGDNAFDWLPAVAAANRIQSLDADGFTVGTAANGSSTVYHGFAFKAVSGKIEVGTYTGNATDNRDIILSGSFEPLLVIVKSATTQNALWSFSSADDSSRRWETGYAWSANQIQFRTSTGFQLGNTNIANQNSITFYYLALQDNPAAAGDTTPPEDVSDLAVDSTGSTSVDLTFTAPGDDADTGTATEYDVRYSTATITEGNWAQATLFTDVDAPQSAGSGETVTVYGLTPETTYYFAMRSRDEVPNESGLSNVVSTTTAAPERYVPTSDVSDGNWSPSTGSDLYAVIDETTTPNDNDYVDSELTPSDDAMEVLFPSVADPADNLAAGLVVKVRALYIVNSYVAYPRYPMTNNTGSRIAASTPIKYSIKYNGNTLDIHDFTPDVEAVDTTVPSDGLPMFQAETAGDHIVVVTDADGDLLFADILNFAAP